MRIGLMLVILFAATAMSCERETSSDSSGPPPTTVTTSPSTRRFDPTTSLLAVTQPTTKVAASSNDPLSTPDGAVKYMFDLMQRQDVSGVRAIMADPLPSDVLRGEVGKVAERMGGGAKWEIVDSRAEDVAAIVLFRTTFPDGKEEISPIMLINRYDRWKVLLGSPNVKKYTPGEKESMAKVARWAADRLPQLRGETTKPATATTTTTR